ncbi:MAG: GNAT family N-acetyltransferase [Proteobacteria bacterium]|nr:GNAT family N-acetyltransferase [Pseudomonadota bacterium]
MDKQFLFLLIIFFSVLNASTPHSNDSVFDLLSFSTERTNVRPLVPENLAAAQILNASDANFVNILNDEFYEGKPSFEVELQNQQHALLQVPKLEDLKHSILTSTLYYGVFKNEDSCLIGIIKISGLISSDCNVFLSTSSKYHKSYQGQGYGTEVKKSLLDYFEQLRLIPTKGADPYAFPFLGFKGLVVFANKASLNYNLKCGYRVGIFSGDDCAVYYPMVLGEEIIDGITFKADDTLHDRIAPSFEMYLKKDPEQALLGEKLLRQEAIVSIMLLEESNLAEMLNIYGDFIAESVGRFPDLFIKLNQNFGHKMSLVKDSVESCVAKYRGFIAENPEIASDSRCQQYLAELEAAENLVDEIR